MRSAVAVLAAALAALVIPPSARAREHGCAVVLRTPAISTHGKPAAQSTPTVDKEAARAAAGGKIMAILDIYKENCGPLSVDAEFGYALTQVGSGADNADIAAGRREALRLLNAVGRERWCSHTRDSELMQKVEALSRAQSNRFRRGE